jgi:hypothetical protein
MLSKQIFGHFLGFFERGIDFFDPYSQQFAAQKSLGPLEMVVMCFVQIKKTFRTFRISNTIIVQILLEMFNVDLAELQQKLFFIIFSPQPPGKCKI